MPGESWQTPPTYTSGETATLRDKLQIVSDNETYIRPGIEGTPILGGTVAGSAGYVLVQGTADNYVALTTNAGTTGPIWVAAAAAAAGTAIAARLTGHYYVRIQGTASRSNTLQTSSVAGYGTAGTVNPFAVCLANSSGGSVWAAALGVATTSAGGGGGGTPSFLQVAKWCCD